MKHYEFDAVMQKSEGMDSAYIEFPYDAQKEFGVKGRVPVRAWFDGAEYRGSLVAMGHTCHWIGVTQAMRKAIGKGPGDTVHVLLERDTAERTVEVPPDFAAALEQEPEIKAFYEGLSFTHRKEYARWIGEAKREETRRARVAKALVMLREKVRHP